MNNNVETLNTGKSPTNYPPTNEGTNRTQSQNNLNNNLNNNTISPSKNNNLLNYVNNKEND